MPEQYCKKCGGVLILNTPKPHQSQCNHCQSIFDTAAAERHSENLRRLFDEQKLSRICNLRRVLYDAVTAEYISRTDVTNACDALRQYLPDDFAAGFYRTVAGGNLRAINAAIRAIDTEEQREELDDLVDFLIRSISGDSDFLLALGDLIERGYKAYDLKRYSRFATMLSEQTEKVLQGVYETTLPRDVFVAYSSKDREAVLELVEALEEQGISCFVALRNLKHGIGSVEGYNEALEEAMESCTVFLFVSSMNSRNMQCDAVKVEMKYIKSQDVALAPAEYHYRPYESIPRTYKKPRVEYYLEESTRLNIADRTTNRFFDGYERVYEVEGVLERVAEILFGDTTDDEEERLRIEEEERRKKKAAAKTEEEERRRKAEKEAEEEARRKAEEAIRIAAAEAARLAKEKAEEEKRAKERAEAERKAREKAEADRKAKEAAELAKFEVGKTVTFGSYEQTPGKGKEPIEWQVLAREGKKALLISKYLLDQHSYHPTSANVTWKTCEMRKWLNGEFLQAAFNAGEQRRILQSTIQNPKNAMWGTNGENSTTDRLFLLSIDEVKKYFPSDSARQAKATPYAKSRGVYVWNQTGMSWWWLRSPGNYAYNAAYVRYGGGVLESGIRVNDGSGGLRPAFWINLES